MPAARWSCCAITRTSTSRRPSSGFAPGAYCRIPVRRAARRCYLHVETSQGPKTPEIAPQRPRSGHPGRTRTCGGASIGRAPGGRPPSPSRRRRSIRPVINTRRWLANRRLWRPELPLPAAVRWAPATGQHTGAGSIVALAPPPVAWAAAWPELPTVAAVQLVHVDAQGQPALDRPAEAGGREKRAMGMLQGAAVVLGNHLLAQPLSKTISIFAATPVPAAAEAGRRASKRAL